MKENTQVLLRNRPVGIASTTDFKVVQGEIPKVVEGTFLVKNNWLSLDPYMRGRMNAGKSYTKPVEVNEVMTGGTVGQVVESKNTRFKIGDYVIGSLGWQKYALSSGYGNTVHDSVRKIDPTIVPPQAYLGVCGMPGVTAWIGLIEICNPKPGETVLVSAASGAVGSVVGQLAKLSGCRIIGIAGGPEKCKYVKEKLNFDECIDYKKDNVFQDLKRACPDGVDCSFENVAGEIMDETLRVLNPFSRIALCGFMSSYNTTEPYNLKNLRSILVNRVKLQGFIVFDRSDLYLKAEKKLISWVSAGKIKYDETIQVGLENAPEAFIGLLKGKNLGKQLVKI